jgi:hypothetical protein
MTPHYEKIIRRQQAILLVTLFGTMYLLNFLASKGWWPAIDWPLLDQLIAYLIREVHPENIKLIVAIAAILFWRRPYYGYRQAIEKKFNARFNEKTIQRFGWKKPSYYNSLSEEKREEIKANRKEQLRRRNNAAGIRGDKLRTWRVKFDRLKQKLENYLHRSKLTKRGKGYQIMESLQEEIDEERKLDDLYEDP